MCAAPPPPLSVSLQGQGEPPLLSSTVRAYVTLLSTLLLRQGVTLCHTSADPVTLLHISASFLQQVEPLLQLLSVCTLLPRISAFPLQRGVPPLNPIVLHVPPLPPLSVLLQGLGISPFLPSAVRAYAPLLWQLEVMCEYHKNTFSVTIRKLNRLK